MKQRGFTIVELLVVIAIISFFLTITISSFPKIQLQLALSRVAYKFDQDVRKAQNLALAMEQYSQEVTGYGVYIDLNSYGNKKYIIYADKPTGSTTLNGISYPVSNKYYDSLDYFIDTIDFSLAEPGIVIKEINIYSCSTCNSAVSNNISIDFNSSDSATIIKTLPSLQDQYSADIVFALESDLTKTRTVSVNQSGSVIIK